jgi:hypothetical protein
LVMTPMEGLYHACMGTEDWEAKGQSGHRLEGDDGLGGSVEQRERGHDPSKLRVNVSCPYGRMGWLVSVVFRWV